ncbi:putative S1 domain, nucleic acid-binding protein [Helianthus annuus]|nr:putative S1 domain, nucleic acid-binding protein [Helianthus annuus]
MGGYISPRRAMVMFRRTRLVTIRSGRQLTAKIVSKSKAEKSSNIRFELSIKPSVLADQSVACASQYFSYSIGQNVTGFVYKVDKDWAWITITRDIRAQLYILDSASDPVELQDFQNPYPIGKRVSGYILTTYKDKQLLRLILHPLGGMTDDNETVTSHI